MNRLDTVLIYVYIVAYFALRTFAMFDDTLSDEIVDYCVMGLAVLLGLYFMYSFIRHRMLEKRNVYKCLFVVLISVFIVVMLCCVN